MSEFVTIVSQRQDFRSKDIATCLKQGANTKGSGTNRPGDILLELMSQVLRRHQLVLVVDALDECSEHALILSLFSSLLSIRTRHPIKIWISCRMQKDTGLFPASGQQVVAIERENLRGIQNYIRICKVISSERVVTRLAERANGLFLWAKLALDRLFRHNLAIEMTEQALQELPDSLETFYQYFLSDLDEGRFFLELRLLRWVALARRPLKVEELIDALSIKPHSQDSIHQHLYSGYLITVIADEVYLIHQTVKTFLLKNAFFDTTNSTASKFEVSARGNLAIAHECTSYLAFHRSDSGPYPEHGLTRPFLEYAGSYWTGHTRRANCPGLSHSTLLEDLKWPSNDITNYWTRLFREQSGVSAVPLEWTLLHVCASFGLYNLALAILEAQGSHLEIFDAEDCTGRTPLSWAAGSGEVRLIQRLLAKGAETDTRDTIHGLPPLLWASYRGRYDCCEQLLIHGADVNDHLSGSNALWIAVLRGHETIVELLLKRGAESNRADEYHGQTALHCAAASGDAILVSILLAHGADPTLPDTQSHRSSLELAVMHGRHTVVSMLLESAVDTSQRSSLITRTVCCRANTAQPPEQRRGRPLVLANLGTSIHQGVFIAVEVRSERTMAKALRETTKMKARTTIPTSDQILSLNPILNLNFRD
ncbi:hypothetical protein MMC25_007042 [Agyrium rufum]|nr:hypothetical protein [Agyrium rufum]